MAEQTRQFDTVTGFPLPFNDAEKVQANVEYNAACQQGNAAKIACLKKFPFIAGRDWARYVDAPVSPSPVPATS